MNNVFLKDFAELITKGTTPSSVGCEFVKEGINFIKSESVSDSKYLNNANYEHINIATDAKLKRSRLKEGDLLFSIAGAYLGKIAIVRSNDLPANTNQAVGIVRLNLSKVDVDYLYYYFSQKHINEYINKLSSQSSQPNLNLDLLGKLEFDYKDLQSQQKIGSVLSSIDSKIEHNNRLNFELESISKTLYDYWFIQFDFPNENDKPYKSSGGKMVWNEELKREIPEGWSDLDLADFEKNIITGKTPPTINDSNFNGDVPFICIGDIRGNMHIVDTELTLSRSGAETQSNKFIPKGAICVSCIASPGLIGFATSNSQTNQQINSIVCEIEENKYFLYFFLKDYFKYAKAKTGNTFANMNKGDFSSIKVLRPPKDILFNFHQHLDSSIKMILSMSIQNQKLAEIRDWLIPMLMNGQVKVK